MFKFKHSINASNFMMSQKSPMTAFTQSVTSVNSEYSIGLLDGFIPSSNRLLNDLFDEIYQFDAICGPTVDIQSTLPFSTYTLLGITDKEVLDVYEKSLIELDIVSTLEKIAKNYLIYGSAISSLIFSEKEGIYTDSIIHNPNNCIVTPIPLVGYDPKIDFIVPKELKQWVRSTDPRDKVAIEQLPPVLKASILSSSKIPLDPLGTLYLQRGKSTSPLSYYSRVLPMWLIEKALIRGTIIGAWRRQRSILHLICGTEDWSPDNKELQELSALFNSADKDPQGSIIATKPGIETSELRSGADFWKISEEWDSLSNMKMKALGINDALLSGDASYNTQEAALSLFIDHVKTFRHILTTKIFYEKIFPNLAKIHGFVKRSTAELTHRVRTMTAKSAMYSDFLIPEIAWTKQLQPLGDQSYLDLLKAAQEGGVPIPLKLLASTVGININVESLDEDIVLRKSLTNYFSELKKLSGEGEEGSEGGGEELESSLKDKIEANVPLDYIKSKGKIPGKKELVLNENQIESIMRILKDGTI